MNKIVIVAKPCLDNEDDDKFFVVKADDTGHHVIVVAGMSIAGSIAGIGNTYAEARMIVRNLA